MWKMTNDSCKIDHILSNSRERKMNNNLKNRQNAINQNCCTNDASPKLTGNLTGNMAKVAISLFLSAGFANAADTVTGAGNGVAYGTGSNAPKAENVAIGKKAVISYSNGASNATGDIAIGNDANINNYASQGGSVAIGKNAKIENMAGGLKKRPLALAKQHIVVIFSQVQEFQRIQQKSLVVWQLGITLSPAQVAP